MPWLSDDIPNWEELSDEEQEAFRAAVRDLGMSFPAEQDESDGYCE